MLGLKPVDSDLSRRLHRGALRVRDFSHSWGSRTLIMGIVNVTPDSFSGDGVLNCADAVAKASLQADSGADIIDIGGQSTRPGHEPVSIDEELKRVLPVLSQFRQQMPAALVSLDTTKPEVLQQALEVDLLNSIWGISDQLLAIAVERALPVVVMHNKERPQYSSSVVDEVLRYLDNQARKAVRAGLKHEHVILDPGIGFGKTAEHNLQVLNQLHRLTALGFPTLIGTSRKSFLGKLTGKNVDQRLAGSLATVSLAVAAGIDIVRVHDVAQTKEALAVSDAIIRQTRPSGWES
ncbi:MAG: dihydropteroate synthase [Cyanobacteria bacterium SZAS LIN-5]|nr:dihydropteroate synthase [Cyanobacteria bacterium SZAS LIN-5]RTL43171.1 MAG: dihydropteroate synthase [Candidatus Melainabacteria bacterium]